MVAGSQPLAAPDNLMDGAPEERGAGAAGEGRGGGGGRRKKRRGQCNGGGGGREKTHTYKT